MNDVYFYTVLIIVVSVLSFGLGRLSVQSDKSVLSPPQIVLTEQSAAVNTSQMKDVSQSPDTTIGAYVASKKGSKYHLPTCPGAKQMSEANKIYFTSEEEARASGYTRAKNCKF